MILDNVSNDASSRRQAKLDNKKSRAQLALEQPVRTAELLSLTGVGSVVVNRWANSFYMNEYMLQQVLRRSSGDGETLAHAVRATVTSAYVPDDAAAGAGGKGKKGKGKATPVADNTGDPLVPQFFKQRVRCCTVVYGLPDVTLQ